jgi:hypothetical protein
MATSEAQKLRKQLQGAGITRRAIDAVWPQWWSAEAEASVSAVSELRFTVARRLGLSPQSLFEDAPRFVWRDEAKFKNLGTATEDEAVVLSSFAVAVGGYLVTATPSRPAIAPEPLSALRLREILLESFQVVALDALLTFAWSIGIPVVQMRLFPLSQKRMEATTVRVRDRAAILVGRESRFQAQIAYVVAHEIGHLVLGHLQTATALLEMEDPLRVDSPDEEELAADRFALELLTGHPDIEVESDTASFTATQLAAAAFAASVDRRIDPGVLALCLGHATGRWRQAIGAQKVLPPGEQDIGSRLNQLADTQLRWSDLSFESQEYLRKVLALTDVQ